MGLALAAAGTVVVVLLLGLLAVLLRVRAETRADLAAARSETAELRARLEALSDTTPAQKGTQTRAQTGARTAARAHSSSVALAGPLEVDGATYVITGAGSEVVAVADRVVLSETLGEPLVKAVALGHGLRRALSAEARNRIRFEMTREVRRTRKQRRREMKDAWRREQAHSRAQNRADAA